MGPKTKELIDVLGQAIALLQEDGEDNWSRGLRGARARLLDSDFGGISMLLAAYGGMGSFCDLIIGQRMEGGQFRWVDGYREKNERLADLRNKIWELADAINRDHDIAGAEPECPGYGSQARRT